MVHPVFQSFNMFIFMKICLVIKKSILYQSEKGDFNLNNPIAKVRKLLMYQKFLIRRVIVAVN